jgi:hypothetical protein
MVLVASRHMFVRPVLKMDTQVIDGANVAWPASSALALPEEHLERRDHADWSGVSLAFPSSLARKINSAI